MSQDLSDYRKDYAQRYFGEKELPSQPIDLFSEWFKAIEQAAPDIEPNAMTLSTIDNNNIPRSRVVLLKGYSDEEFVFFTNYNSQKGKDIAANPRVSLSFFWEALGRQVLIQGKASKVSDSFSNHYFDSRPIGSRLGVMASPQSEVISSYEVLAKKMSELEKKYKDHSPERPKYWGGYAIYPLSIEFWQGRPNRLHDRICYTREYDSSWRIQRLAP